MFPKLTKITQTGVKNTSEWKIWANGGKIRDKWNANAHGFSIVIFHSLWMVVLTSANLIPFYDYTL